MTHCFSLAWGLTIAFAIVMGVFDTKVQVVSDAEVVQQQQAFQALLKKLGQASSVEIESVLAKMPEAELNLDAIGPPATQALAHTFSIHLTL